MSNKNSLNNIYFDSHAHYNLDPFINEIDKNIDDLKNNNVFINIVGVDLNSSMEAIKLAKKYDFVCSVGIHPCDCYETNDNDYEQLEKIIINNKDVIKSIGECGLDYHYENTNKQKQIYAFKKQIELALKFKLNLIIHVRDASGDLIKILDEYNLNSINVIIHCFDDDIDLMNEYLKRGFYISFSGNVTFKKNDALREAIKKINIDFLLTETDSPYLAPVPVRGTVNNSLNIKYINQFIANLLNIPIDCLNEKLKNNFIKLFI